MQVAEGILTARGGMTSHAAVVARGMGKCCVAGCSALEIDYSGRHAQGRRRHGDSSRRIPHARRHRRRGDRRDACRPSSPRCRRSSRKFMGWADAERATRRARQRRHAARRQSRARIRRRRYRAVPHRAYVLRARADRGGARDDPGGERASSAPRALAKILPMQRDDFVGILREMAGLPVTIRLLDPPLHEFLPKEEDGDSRARGQDWHHPGASQAGARQPVRVQPDAGPSRLAPGYQLSRKSTRRRRARFSRRRCQLRARGRQGDSGNHAAADRRAKEFEILAGEIREVAARGVQGNAAKVASRSAR